MGVARRPRDKALVIERREGESVLAAPGLCAGSGHGRRSPAIAMGLGASAEQPAGGAEGFHLHGVSRPRGAGDLGPARLDA